MVAYAPRHGNIVYFTLNLIPPLTLGNFFWLFYQDSTLDLKEQVLDLINRKNMFKLKWLKVKWLLGKLTPEEDLQIDNKGESGQ